MPETSTPTWRKWTFAGLFVATIDLVLLCGVALFDNGRLADDWLGTLPLMGGVALPNGLALIGLRRPSLLLAAGLITFPIAILSLATMPLIASAMCYLMGYGKSAPAVPREPQE